VLVVVTPCSLIFATPIAIMGGINYTYHQNPNKYRMQDIMFPDRSYQRKVWSSRAESPAAASIIRKFMIERRLEESLMRSETKPLIESILR